MPGPRDNGPRPTTPHGGPSGFGGPRPMAPHGGPRSFTPPPPRPIGPPPRRYSSRPHNGIGSMIAGALISSAIHNAANSMANTMANTMMNQRRTGGTTYNTGTKSYNSNGMPANYPASCPCCGAGTTGRQTCDYCGTYLY